MSLIETPVHSERHVPKTLSGPHGELSLLSFFPLSLFSCLSLCVILGARVSTGRPVGTSALALSPSHFHSLAPTPLSLWAPVLRSKALVQSHSFALVYTLCNNSPLRAVFSY